MTPRNLSALAPSASAPRLEAGDLAAISFAYDAAIRTRPSGARLSEAISWQNTATGRRGRLTPFAFIGGTVERPCQTVTIEVEIEGDYRVLMGEACRSGGRWQVTPAAMG